MYTGAISLALLNSYYKRHSEMFNKAVCNVSTFFGKTLELGKSGSALRSLFRRTYLKTDSVTLFMYVLYVCIYFAIIKNVLT